MFYFTWLKWPRYSKGRLFLNQITLSFEGQDDQEWSKQYQKWIQRTQISWIRCITHVYVLDKKSSNVFIMAIFDLAMTTFLVGCQTSTSVICLVQGLTNLIQARNDANAFLQTGL